MHIDSQLVFPLKRARCGQRRLLYLLLAAGILISGCSPTPSIPDPADLLDGRIANGERLAAIERVGTWADRESVPPEGITKVGTQIGTVCQLGQNNYKVQDGYEIYCQAGARVFFGWSGDFGRGRARLERALESECDGPGGFVQGETPQTKFLTSGGSWRCPSSLSYSLNYGDVAEIRDTDNAVTRDPCGGASTARCISGPSAQEIASGVDDYQWVAIQLIDTDFYRVLPTGKGHG